MPSVIMPSVILPSVVAPSALPFAIIPVAENRKRWRFKATKRKEVPMEWSWEKTQKIVIDLIEFFFSSTQDLGPAL